MTRGAQDRARALHVVHPGVAAGFFADDEACLLLVVRHRGAPRARRRVGIGRHGDGRGLRDHRREHEATRVVGVLADQVDAPRGVADDRPPMAEVPG